MNPTEDDGSTAISGQQAERDSSDVVDAAEQGGSYTSSAPAGGSGGYTSSQDPVKEGEYTDKDKSLVDEPEDQGEYTDRDR